jgi:hypothetical protein
MLDLNESLLNDCLVCFLCSLSLHMTGGLNIHHIEQGYFLDFCPQSTRQYTYRPKLAEEFPEYRASVIIRCGCCIMYEPGSFRGYLEVLLCVRHRGPMQTWTVFMHPNSWAGVVNGGKVEIENGCCNMDRYGLNYRQGARSRAYDSWLEPGPCVHPLIRLVEAMPERLPVTSSLAGLSRVSISILGELAGYQEPLRRINKV